MSDFNGIYERDLVFFRKKLNASIKKKIDCINLEDKKGKSVAQQRWLTVPFLYDSLWWQFSLFVWVSLVNCWNCLSFTRAKKIQYNITECPKWANAPDEYRVELKEVEDFFQNKMLKWSCNEAKWHNARLRNKSEQLVWMYCTRNWIRSIESSIRHLLCLLPLLLAWKQNILYF